MNPHYPQVALRAGHRCEYCHAPEAVFNLPLEVEHIVPVARGGEDTAANWALACLPAISIRPRMSVALTPRVRLVRLWSVSLHPRADRWDDHFHVAPESGELVGRTPIGQAHSSCAWG